MDIRDIYSRSMKLSASHLFLNDKMISLEHYMNKNSRVWDDEEKSKYIESILLNLPITDFVLFEDSSDTYKVIDGLNRLNAINDFIHDRYVLKNLDFFNLSNDKKFSELELPYQRRITEKRLNLLVIELYDRQLTKYVINRYF